MYFNQMFKNGQRSIFYFSFNDWVNSVADACEDGTRYMMNIVKNQGDKFCLSQLLYWLYVLNVKIYIS